MEKLTRLQLLHSLVRVPFRPNLVQKIRALKEVKVDRQGRASQGKVLLINTRQIKVVVIKASQVTVPRGKVVRIKVRQVRVRRVKSLCKFQVLPLARVRRRVMVLQAK
jgi:hypothetical protein